jgi:hypothetical protein
MLNRVGGSQVLIPESAALIPKSAAIQPPPKPHRNNNEQPEQVTQVDLQEFHVAILTRTQKAPPFPNPPKQDLRVAFQVCHITDVLTTVASPGAPPTKN